jgi:RNA 2',3'-cyclic 3'-phosphodiesterase
VAEHWFFALWPDEATAAALAARAAPLIPVAAPAGDPPVVPVDVRAGARTRTTHPLDLHLTLYFLGELNAPRLQSARQAADAVRGRALRLAIDQAGVFRHSRILWCGPSQTPAALSQLVGALTQALVSQGFTPESRPFRPHITLARRYPGTAVPDWGPSIQWQPAHLCLAHGREAQVPRYVVRRRWPLAGAG